MYGRRRIGKTFLINSLFEDKFTFKTTGNKMADNSKKLELFYNDLLLDKNEYSLPKDWYNAFKLLEEVIINSNQAKKVIFIDELAWMYNKNSNMIGALEHFWNSFCSTRNDVLLIVASSSSSWINDKIIHNKDGLYNRLTRTFEIKEFTLKECEEYVSYKELGLSKMDILEAYMFFGGIPYYWNFISRGDSISIAIDKMFFNDDALVKNEFDYLFSSLYDKPLPYIKIIKALSAKKQGLTISELSKESKLPSNGDLKTYVTNLELSSFVRIYPKYNSKKEYLIQLIDNFCLFHYKYLNEKKITNFSFTSSINTPKRNNFLGLSFEMVCLKHLNQILCGLGINGIIVNAYSYYKKGTEEEKGCQIDLVLERADRIFNICEMKYSDAPYVFSKDDSEKLDNRINVFSKSLRLKRSIMPILISPYGLNRGKYSSKIYKVLTLDDLFL